uniref:Uncharacterized protein n=1 Tax=Sphaerodactylus townsendi TaxID=933632 RepID=A0ACB8F5U9_9SAUR
MEGVFTAGFFCSSKNQQDVPHRGFSGKKKVANLLLLRNWTVEELQRRLGALDPMMEQEIEEVRQRYQSKRQPILDAIEAKKRRQQNF